MSVNMNAHLYTKKERDIHTICKRCKAQAPINCSKEDYNLFLNYLPYTQSYNIEKQHLFFTDQFRRTCMHLCFLCSGVHDCVGEYMCDLHVLRNKRS